MSMFYDRMDRKIKYRATPHELEVRNGIFTARSLDESPHLERRGSMIRKWYVSVKGGCEYMHKDLTVHCTCGHENMYDTEGEAIHALDAYRYRHGKLLEDSEFRSILDELCDI